MAQPQHAVFLRGMDQQRVPFTPSGSSPVSGTIIDLSLGNLAATTGFIGVVTDPQGLEDGKLGSVASDGVFKVRKLAVVFTAGDMVGFDFSADGALGAAIATGGATDHVIGMCVVSALAGDDHVQVRINKARAVA